MGTIKVREVNFNDLNLLDCQLIEELRNFVDSGNLLILKNYISKKTVSSIIHYLSSVGRSSIANYQSIHLNCANFHRLNREDGRAYVKGCFHQFVFFPWNQDVFNFFEMFKGAYNLKNILSGIAQDKFLANEPDDECIARLAFQFYSKGEGFLNKHRDPVDYHQTVVPVLIMSEKGVDYESGGLYVETDLGEREYLDDLSSIGDILYFNASMIHGVDKIDLEHEKNWLRFEGRWMGLLAVNKLDSNTRVEDSQDLES